MSNLLEFTSGGSSHFLMFRHEESVMIKNRLLNDLPAEELERLRPYLEPVQLDLRQHLLHIGEPIPYVWFPDDCVTSTVVNTEGGATMKWA